MAGLAVLNEKLKALADKFDVFPPFNDRLVLGGLVGLSYIGIAITNISPGVGRFYWLLMVPVFAAVVLFSQWVRLRGQEVQWTRVLREQLFHWVGLFIAVQIVYMLVRDGRLHYEASGLVITLLFTFAMFLEGVHLDWRYYLVALFLALGLVVAAIVETYLWIILLIFALVTVAAGLYIVKLRGSSPPAVT
jgi:hypothetical protein